MALYRKYRPATFGEVIGQEQVTVPLSTALDNGRINHAYLFSGPRGCGKTSSARILARSLNCVEGPTSNPCGVCESCRSLAPGGSGNLDVMELDAASHGGVDDMRDLRERAMFAPAESRYRVFIIDEAHMISQSGNNALLKIVEEPPEHLIFIFATTEPEKMLGTIRSRTHNYPFRLLTPQAMRELLERVVAEEGTQVDDTVYPLVIRAGGGSPRDTLSVLDQLLAGAGPDGLTYDLALPLLGVTDLSLLDAAVDALAARDASAIFHTIDNVIESGHEPRRFALDLLDRLRDLLVVRTVPDAFAQGLVDAPVDRADILRAEAEQFTPAQLSALATEVNHRIQDLRGATSPRLLLEVMMAHLLTIEGAAAGAAPAGGPAAGAAPAGGGAAAAAAAAAAAGSRGGQVRSKSTPPPQRAPQPGKPAEPAQPAQQEQPAQPAQQKQPAEPAQQEQPAQASAETHADEAVREGGDSGASTSEGSSTDALYDRVVRDWTTLRQSVGERNKVAEIMLTEAKPLGMDGETLVIGHNTGALAERINAEGNNADIVAVFEEKLGQRLAVRCVVGTSPNAANVQPRQAPRADQVWNPNQGASSNEPSPEEPAGAGAHSARRNADSPLKHRAEANDWKAAAQAASKKAAEKAQRERDEIPPPPEPMDDEPDFDPYASGAAPLPQDPAAAPQQPTQPEQPAQPYSREDEERDMAEQAHSEEGELDHRDATEVAMELLSKELGAKPL